MTDLATIDAPANPVAADSAVPADTRSTVIDTDRAPSASGAGVVRQPAEPTLRDTIAAAVQAEDGKASEEKGEADEKGVKSAEKADAKAEPEAKKAETSKEDAQPKPARDRADDGKFKGSVEQEDKQARADDGEGEDDKQAPHISPPPRLLPDARERWTNTPRAVQRDVDNMVREYEGEIARHAQATERYETLRPFDDLARSNGRDLRESLLRINQIENMMRANLPAALNEILREIGPRKADGAPINLYELASAIVSQGPGGYQNAIAQGQQQQQIADRDAETERLRRENEDLRARQQASEIEAKIVAPFRAGHPRYDELQEDIAFFLNSGRIPAGLSPFDRLEAAYSMAERINPSPSSGASPRRDPDPDAGRVEHDFSGSKSIKSAPGAVSDFEDEQAHGSIRDLLSRNMMKLSRAG